MHSRLLQEPRASALCFPASGVYAVSAGKGNPLLSALNQKMLIEWKKKIKTNRISNQKGQIKVND